MFASVLSGADRACIIVIPSPSQPFFCATLRTGGRVCERWCGRVRECALLNIREHVDVHV